LMVVAIFGLLALTTCSVSAAEYNDILDAYDRTNEIINRTVYIEYLYEGFRGSWLGPSGWYEGRLLEVLEDNIFIPEEGVRIDLRDCDDGWACIRTRWHEDEQTKAEDKELRFNFEETEGDVKTADAKTQNNNWFLESSGDPNFKQSVAPEYNNALKWKFFCKSESDMERCYICDSYYTSTHLPMISCMYGTNWHELRVESFDVNPEDWYAFKIVAPTAKDQGFIDSELSVCNLSGQPVEMEISKCQGTSVTTGSSWSITNTVSKEVHAGIEIDLVSFGGSGSHSVEWGVEMSHEETFSEETCTVLKPKVMPGKQIWITQLVGTYGPYNTKTSNYRIMEEDCYDSIDN